MLLKINGSRRNLLVFALCSILFVNCSPKKKMMSSATVDNSLLEDRTHWVTKKLRNDLVWYHFAGMDTGVFAHQIVNVLDLSNSNHHLVPLLAASKDSLSSLGLKEGDVVAGINGTYFLEAKDHSPNYMYLRLNNNVIQTVMIKDTSILYWKHKGMIAFNDDGSNIRIGKSPENFDLVKADNVLTGAPLLIDNFDPVGLRFADTTGKHVNSLNYEDPLRHQGVRHPRTAIALTADHHLLLIAVDGRNSDAVGMSAKELTLFLQTYFHPQSALNLDGGGSTTMWVKGEPFNGIVNYPTDNGKFDHYGQRRVETTIFIR
jgi:exopolysaccharide biosynthesis protein